jgi:protocatechuate 3,4-dioxygenase beta subunit
MLSRRYFIRSAVGAASALQLISAERALGLQAPQACRLASEQEVGPYYVADEMIRQDIRENEIGFPLLLELTLVDSRTCKPLVHAAVDVWHCDALGLYSGFTAMNPTGGGHGVPAGPPDSDSARLQRMPPPPGVAPGYASIHPGEPYRPPDTPWLRGGGPPENRPTDNLTFLRGVQFTDEHGRVRFQTVFPGCYMGRVNHIHCKVRLGGHIGEAGGHRTYLAGHTAHVGQVFFPEAVTADLMKLEPYARHQIQRTTLKEDGVFQRQHGELSLSQLHFVRPGSPQSGLRAQLAMVVDPDATPSPVGFRPGGPHPRLPPRL